MSWLAIGSGVAVAVQPVRAIEIAAKAVVAAKTLLEIRIPKS